MSWNRRRLLVALILMLFAALLPLPGTAPAADAEPKNGSDDVATCLQSARSLSALFLYDQSGSLTDSDPKGIRYDGLRVALESLARVNRADGASVAIEAAVSSFDDTYYPARDIVAWTRLNEGDSDQIAKTIDGIVAKAKRSTPPTGGTNFTEAMNGAWNDIKDRGARGTCRVIFWFTDGADEANTVGGQACMPDSGLLDQIRKAGIVVVGLQLGQHTDDLQAIATGGAASVQCGRNPIPSDWAGGVYIQAADTAAMRRLFGTLGNIVRGCTPQGARGGRIDPGIRAMNVTIDTPQQVNAVRLDAPDGTVITAAPNGSTTEGDYTALGESDESYLSLLVDFPYGKGAGEWTVSAGQAVAPADIQFCVFSGLHLERVDPNTAPVAGGTAEIIYRAVDSDGREADLSEYKDAVPGAAAVAANDDIRKATATREGNRIVVRVDTDPTDARLQLRLTVGLTTVSDLALTPLAVDEGVGFKLNEAFPTITPIDQLDLGAAQKSKPATRVLTLLGSPLGPTRVCFDQPVNMVVPQDQPGAKLDLATGCAELAQGDSKNVQVTATPVVPTVGNGEAELPIRLVPVAGSPMDGQEALVVLPVVWRYENPRDVKALWGVIVIATLLSLTLPLFALAAANWFMARFTIDNLRSAQLPVLIGPDGARRVDPIDEAPDAVIDSFSMDVTPLAGRRQFTIGPLEFTSRSGINPFRPPTFTVKPTSPGFRVLSSVPPATNDGSTALAIPGLGFFAAAVVSDADLRNPRLREVPATLVVLVRDLKLSSAQMDPLLNSKMNWSVITQRWRESVHVDGPGGPGPESRRGSGRRLHPEPPRRTLGRCPTEHVGPATSTATICNRRQHVPAESRKI